MDKLVKKKGREGEVILTPAAPISMKMNYEPILSLIGVQKFCALVQQGPEAVFLLKGPQWRLTSHPW